MKKIVLLHSGGLDSTVMLAMLQAEGNDCYPLSINYGQRHFKELVAAERICAFMDLTTKRKSLDLTNITTLIKTALHGNGEIPHGHYSDEIQKATVSPNRNMILLSIAAGYAECLGADTVAYAAHANDRAIYPDCRPDFIESVAKTLNLGTGGKVSLYEPFQNVTKSDIVELGVKYAAPMYLTWSCYEGGKRPCLQCGTCLERTEAFKLACEEDPALTNDEWDKALQYLEKYAKGDKDGQGDSSKT
jgi:7-cyano-7-deazaguanine synthase